jgi:hypothetical protein
MPGGLASGAMGLLFLTGRSMTRHDVVSHSLEIDSRIETSRHCSSVAVMSSESQRIALTTLREHPLLQVKLRL